MSNKVPQIRFNGYSDSWEERKLTDVTSSYSGLTYSPTDVQDKGTFVLRSSNVKTINLLMLTMSMSILISSIQIM